MKAIFVGCVLLAVSASVYSQVRLDRLELAPNEEYKLIGSDIIVVDTLIMHDSSRIVLNQQKAENFIHAKVARIGKGCVIMGDGKSGTDGVAGANGFTAEGPCKDGTRGRGGFAGTHGRDGINLSLYFGELSIDGIFHIEINGGHGGDGGKGGSGGGGSPGTKLCAGGNGGMGGNGGGGGNGGNGGTLTISCKTCPDLRLWLGNQLLVRNYRGNAGLGGRGGPGGLAGLGTGGDPNEDGSQGQPGKDGRDGIEGKDGGVTFDQP